MADNAWADVDSHDSHAVQSASDEEARRGSEANTISTQDDAGPKTPGDQAATETLDLNRKLSAEEVKRKASIPELHQSSLSHGFNNMPTTNLEANRPPAPPISPPHQAHFPNQYDHSPGHGRYSSPRAPSLPDLHSPGSERHSSVQRNPVSDTWRSDAYEKFDRERVTKMSEIEAKQDRWKCEGCGVLNERGKTVCTGCGDQIGLAEWRYGARGREEDGVRWNALGVKVHKLRRSEGGAEGEGPVGEEGRTRGEGEGNELQDAEVEERAEEA
ncbi:Nn.00g069150.m01.CDS01 [Neocucurbitaria sp. VM-36]